MQQIYADVAAFGNAAQYDEVITAERRILDVTVSLSEIVYDIDGHGRVCDVVRRFMLTPQQAVDMFQGASSLPPKLVDMAEKQDRTKYAFFHRVGKNSMYSKGKLGPAGKAWFSRYSCEIDCTLIRVSGYDDMPFYAPRWDVDTGHIYGTGPAFNALASARVHNRMTDATIRAAQRAADPTILAPDKGDWPLNGLIQPGKVVYGAINPMNGQTMLRPLDVTGGFNLTLQERQNVMEEIRDAFHYSLMSLSGRTGMTATEVMAITEERQRLWAPHQGRLQEEYLAPKFARRFQLLFKAGQLRPPPPGLAGKELRVTYRSAAAAAQRSTEGNVALRILQDIAPLAQMSPEAAQRLADRLDPDGTLEVLMDARGAPARMMRSREDADARAQARAEAQQQIQQMQAMQQGAGVIKDMAGAEAALAGAQGGVA
ncbi:portal protein [Rhodoferax sp.]|uniref:portal protein n=1 Tax=Rhodoferax sp. TaxID=50421 RepID=UPI002ACD4BE5|nr:portal protein [Rhodoferax sp.]MDZ7919977.1 portal protein [Rhodoferax sp.]